MFERTPALEAFISPAKGDGALWRTLVTFMGGVLLYVFWTALIVGLGALMLGTSEDFGATIFDFMIEFTTGSSPVHMALLLSTFIAMAGAAFLMVTLYGRSPRSLFGPRTRFARYFCIAIGVLVFVQIIYAVLESVIAPKELIPNLALSEWLTYLPWAIPLLFIQTTAEELVFRGYLLQQLAVRFKHWVWWMVLPSLIFGLGHFDDTIDPNLAYLIVFATTFFGFIAADLTRITGNLAAAMGLHFINNFLALLVIGMPGQLSGLALYHTPFNMDDVAIVQTYLMIDIAVLTAIWLILRRVLR